MNPYARTEGLCLLPGWKEHRQYFTSSTSMTEYTAVPTARWILVSNPSPNAARLMFLAVPGILRSGEVFII